MENFVIQKCGETRARFSCVYNTDIRCPWRRLHLSSARVLLRPTLTAQIHFAYGRARLSARSRIRQIHTQTQTRTGTHGSQCELQLGVRVAARFKHVRRRTTAAATCSRSATCRLATFVAQLFGHCCCQAEEEVGC